MTEHSRAPRTEVHNSTHPLAHHHIPESLDSITPLAYTNRMIEEGNDMVEITMMMVKMKTCFALHPPK